MAQTEEMVKQPERGNAQAPPDSGSKHGILITLIVLLIVAALAMNRSAIARKIAAQEREYDLAVPTVNVMHPKQGAPQTEIVLPGNMQAFTESRSTREPMDT